MTRPKATAGPTVEGLAALGATVLLLPSVVIAPPADPGPLRRAVSEVDRWDWIVFTSANGVRAFAGAAGQGGAEPPSRPRARLAVVGPATAEALEELGWEADLVPEVFTAEGLLSAFDASGGLLESKRILLPVAEAATDVLPSGLRRRGARVTRIVAYRSVPPAEDLAGPVRAALLAGEVDLLTFTSPSTAENFLAAVGPPALSAPAAVIGPVTASAARGLGYDVRAVAPVHTTEALVGLVARLLGPGGELP